MKIKKNGEIINLTETDLKRITQRFLNEQLDVSRNGDEINITGGIDIKVKLKQLKQSLMAAIGSLVGAGVSDIIDKHSLNVFIDEVVQALNTTFVNNPEKLKNLIPHFSTLEKEIAQIIKSNRNMRDTDQMEEDIKNALVEFVKSPGRIRGNTSKTKEKYSITDEEINTFSQKLDGIKLKNNKRGIEETKIRIKKNGAIINLTETDLKRILRHSIF